MISIGGAGATFVCSALPFEAEVLLLEVEDLALVELVDAWSFLGRCEEDAVVEPTVDVAAEEWDSCVGASEV